MEHIPGIIDLLQKAKAVETSYANFPVAVVNDHVVRMSVMTEPFYWHCHPNSDESFLVLEGSLLIELDEETIELQPGQLYTIPKNKMHRTSPGPGRSVNITFEALNMETIKSNEK